MDEEHLNHMEYRLRMLMDFPFNAEDFIAVAICKRAGEQTEGVSIGLIKRAAIQIAQSLVVYDMSALISEVRRLQASSK